MDGNSKAVLAVLLTGLICLIVWLMFRHLKEWRRQKQVVSDERNRLLGQPIPPDVDRDIVRALSGDFDGEELSPFTYLGYRVGKTHGLRQDARRKRLKICFAMEMPNVVSVKYRRWGGPVTYHRYACMFNFLRMLANQRRGRPNYEFAVADWDSDLKWLENEFGGLARELRKFGFRR